MRKRVFGRHLKRDTNERKALFKNLMTELVLHEKITTTEEKAKSIRAKVEKLVTKAKKKGAQSEYLLQPYLSAEAVKKMISDIAVRFATRPGGYTRIIKLGNRFNDNASMAVIELVDRKEEVVNNSSTPKKKAGKIKGQEIEDLDEIQEAEIIAEEPKKKSVKKTAEKPAKNAEEKEKAKKQKQKASKEK